MDDNILYPYIEPVFHEAVEKIKGVPSGETLGDFWRWAYSDILGNTERGDLAEYIVACALGVQNDERIAWNSYDLNYRNKGIEVKTSAYLQTWGQGRLSEIRFDIAKKLGWDYRTNKYDGIKKRHSDLYVFCVFTEKDKLKANTLDTAQWRFRIVPTEKIDRIFDGRQSVSEKELVKRTGASEITFEKIRQEADRVIDLLSEYRRDKDV